MVRVVGEDTEEPVPDPVPAEVHEPAGPLSPLGLLRGKRAGLEASLYKDLLVPRWEGRLAGGVVIWVRYGPANPATFNASMTKREQAHLNAKSQGKTGDPDWVIKANADLLVSACIGVYTLPPDEEPPEFLPEGLPTFGTPELSADLECQPNAVATVRAVYATDADVLLAAAAVLNWSGQVSREADTSFLER